MVGVGYQETQMKYLIVSLALILVAGCSKSETQVKDIIFDDGVVDKGLTDAIEIIDSSEVTRDVEFGKENEGGTVGEAFDILEGEQPEDSALDTAPVLCPHENLEPPEFTFEVSGDGLEPTDEVPYAAFIGDGVVVERKYEGEMFVLKVAFEDRAPISISSKLPHSYVCPVALGANIRLFVARLKSGAFSGLALVMWDKGGGDPVFFFQDTPRRGRWHQCSGEARCPSADLEIPDCAPLLDDCGAIMLPRVEIKPYSSSKIGAILRQGEEQVVEKHRFVALSGYEYESNSCEQRPDVRVAAVFGESSVVSQCFCLENADCANGFFCDRKSHRCLEDLCRPEAVAQSSCKDGFVCDPYRGACIDPFKKPPVLCSSDADCPAGNICNQQMRLCSSETECQQEISVCVPDICAIIDCAPCEPLLGKCATCLSDCDCQSAGQGDLCVWNHCQTCDLAKIGFSKENPRGFELYEICVRKDEPDAWNKVKAIDPNLQCMEGSSGAFAKCDPSTEDRCIAGLEVNHGLGNGKQLSERSVSALCELAGLDFVTKIAGGYYLR